jgi:hypothetical protein
LEYGGRKSMRVEIASCKNNKEFLKAYKSILENYDLMVVQKEADVKNEYEYSVVIDRFDIVIDDLEQLELLRADICYPLVLENGSHHPLRIRIWDDYLEG